MTQRKNPITEADLHAYVDGQLDDELRGDVEAYLEEHPDARTRVQRYQALNESLRARFEPVLHATIPPQMQPPSPRARPSMRSIAAAVTWLTVGGAVSAIVQSGKSQQALTPVETDLIRPAAFAHAVYTPETRHAVEVTADQHAHLVSWLSQRLHTDIRAPDLSGLGYQLIGGRLLPSTNRMAAQFMYENAAGQRITLYVRTGAWQNEETAFQYAHENGTGVLYWVDGPRGYAISGQVDKQKLFTIATTAYQSLGEPDH